MSTAAGPPPPPCGGASRADAGADEEAPAAEAAVGSFGAITLAITDPSVLVLTGEIDIAVARRNQDRLPEWAAVRTLDARGMTFLDSSGMRLLAQLARLVAPARLRAVDVPERVLQTMTLFGADRVLDLQTRRHP